MGQLVALGMARGLSFLRPLIEDDGMMKGYAGGLVSFRRTDLSHVGHVGGFRFSDDRGVSFTVCLGFGVREDDEAQQTDDVCPRAL